MPVTVDLEKCVGTRDCLNACAFNAIDVIGGKAVVYENCVDCDACVRACPTHALISATPSEATARGGILVADFGDRSGIVAAVDRAARGASVNVSSVRVDPTDAAAAADAVANEAKSSGSRVVVLPHAGAGPAIAARVAATLGAASLSGCEGFTIDDAGGVRATRIGFGGIVKMSSRTAPGTTVITVVPKTHAPFSSHLIETAAGGTVVGDAPRTPGDSARTIVAIANGLPDDAALAARGIADALGASLLEADAVAGKHIAPELYIAVGVDGSTEHNAAVNGAGTIVALVSQSNAPIAQVADYLLAGDVDEDSKALLSAL
ncbi:MAG: 4Fe-4S binding protein [Candidatus Eremiobacteraeota bacterium]|nr:4Fe-4S binding protein [Candidatus Eremiobacteraeota bacterium]